jgi:uncharacterized membrane protein YtjA (UPF0391 family)
MFRLRGASRQRLAQAALENALAGTFTPTRGYRLRKRSRTMSLLKWALIMFLVSVVAGVLGFTNLSAASADVARVLFYIFVVIFLVLLVLGLTIFRA